MKKLIQMRFTPTDGPTLIFLGMFVVSLSLTTALIGFETLGRILAVVGLVLSAFGVWPELSYRSKNAPIAPLKP